MRLSRTEAKRLGVTLPPRRLASQTRAGYASALESKYAEHLEARRLLGEIMAWSYETVTLDLGGASYTPDFAVLANDKKTEYHEVKGRIRDGDRLKLRIAANRFPNDLFVLVTSARKEFSLELIVAETPKNNQHPEQFAQRRMPS
jgi:predicted nuclease of restriction endonuclease-like RecB superfamily